MEPIEIPLDAEISTDHARPVERTVRVEPARPVTIPTDPQWLLSGGTWNANGYWLSSAKWPA